MAIQLISDSQVDDLPDGPEGFLGFQKICRESLDHAERELNAGETYPSWRHAYMGCVSEAALEYGVDSEGELSPRNYVTQYNNSVDYDFEAFDRNVGRLVTRLQIRLSRGRKASQLVLPEEKQRTIVAYVDALRARIAEEASLDEVKRKALNKKLDELVAHLNGKKINLTQTMIIVASVFAAINQAQGAAIKLPDSIAAILRVLGVAHEYQQSLLPPPPPEPKQLTHQPNGSFRARESKERFPEELDDEIPF